MIRSHHITAQLAREHQCDLLLAARDARGAAGVVNGPVEAVHAAASAPGEGMIVRAWRARQRLSRSGASEQGEPARQASGCA
jgi:hypothetical protein